MTLNEYQVKAMATCMPSCDNFSYMMLNLVGEVGELASKIAKAIRRGYVQIVDGRMIYNAVEYAEDETFRSDVEFELGDILWQWIGLCNVLGLDPDAVAQMNLDKLASRKNRGVIDGNGDHR